jgi:hypothetical protein
MTKQRITVDLICMLSKGILNLTYKCITNLNFFKILKFNV